MSSWTMARRRPRRGDSSMIETAKAALLLGSVGVWLFLVLSGRYRVSCNAGAVLAAAWIFIALAGFGAAGLSVSVTDGAEPSYGGVSLLFLVTAAAIAGPLIVYGLSRARWVWRALAGWALTLAIAALYRTGDHQTLSPPVIGTALLWLVAAVAPAQALALWTAEDRHVGARSVLQGMIWVALLLWVFPSVALIAEGRDWSFLLQRAAHAQLLWLIPLALPAALIVAALWQFAREGNGTGFPYDPPKRLVCHGVYAYISNPMQLGIVLLMAWWGVVLQSPIVLASAPVAVLLFIVFSDVCSGVSNVAISDPGWRAYKRNVPAWRPRLSPWQAPHDGAIA